MGPVRILFFATTIALLVAAAAVEGWVLFGENEWKTIGHTSSTSSKTVVVALSHRSRRQRPHFSLGAAKDDKKGGYKFGDFTKSIGRKVTGDENYKFGDISRKLDQEAKARVSSLTGQKDYQFGDLSRWADSAAKERAANFTGNANYQVGDISKEVTRRVWAGEYELEDVILAFRVMIQMGASFTPIAQLLPVKVLLEVLNVGLAQDIGGKVMGGVAKTLDERFKTAITGDAKYQMGDMTKKQLSGALSKFTGQDSYTFGDISKTVAGRVEEMETADKGKSTTKSTTKSNVLVSSESATVLLEELSENDALAEWDKQLLAERTDNKSTPSLNE